MRRRALGLLARREHSRQELRQKLGRGGQDAALVEAVIEDLAAENLQSDDRYTEAYVRERIGKGYGPLYISQGLRSRGIDDSLIDQYLDSDDPDWIHRAAEAGMRRFGRIDPGDLRTCARAVRFLRQRGFSDGQIRRALRGIGEDD